jgi:hypothetical protein
MDESVAEHSHHAASRKVGSGHDTFRSWETGARPVGEAGVRIVGDPVLSFDDVINAIGELFSDPRATEPEFSDEIYARAKPLFEAAIALLMVQKQSEERAWRVAGCAKTMPAQSRPDLAPRSRSISSRPNARRHKRTS